MCLWMISNNRDSTRIRINVLLRTNRRPGRFNISRISKQEIDPQDPEHKHEHDVHGMIKTTRNRTPFNQKSTKINNNKNNTNLEHKIDCKRTDFSTVNLTNPKPTEHKSLLESIKTYQNPILDGKSFPKEGTFYLRSRDSNPSKAEIAPNWGRETSKMWPLLLPRRLTLGFKRRFGPALDPLPVMALWQHFCKHQHIYFL